MEELLVKYKNIINRYKKGDFGNEVLTLDEILSRAGEKDLLDRMSLTELQSLMNSSSGILKKLFSDLIDRKMAN